MNQQRVLVAKKANGILAGQQLTTASSVPSWPRRPTLYQLASG